MSASQITVGDPSADRAEVELLLEMGCSSVLMVPLFARGEPIGLLEAFSEDHQPFSRQRIGIARTIAHQLAIMLQADADRWTSATTAEQQDDVAAAPAEQAVHRPGMAAEG